MRIITVTLPMSATHPLSGLRVRTPLGEECMVFSKDHKTAEIEVPEGVSEDEIEIIGGVCNARGQWDEGLESVVLHAAKKAETQPEGQGEGKGDEVKIEVTSGSQIPVTQPPKHDGRKGRKHDKPVTPADKPTEAVTETPAETPVADKPAEPNTETAADTPAEKS